MSIVDVRSDHRVETGTTMPTSQQTLPWGVGVNIPDFMYADLTRHVEQPDDLQARQLEALSAIGINRIRFFAFYNGIDANESVRRAAFTLDLLRQYGCSAVLTLLDGQASAFNPDSNAPYNTVDYFSARRYRETALPAIEQIVGALREHPSLLAWELGNRLALRPPVSADESRAFMTFVSEIGGAILGIDPNAYIGVGAASCADVTPEDERPLFAHRLYTLGIASLISVGAGTTLERAKAAQDYALATELKLPFYAFDVAFDVAPDALKDEGEAWQASDAFAIFVSPESAAASAGTTFPWTVEFDSELIVQANSLVVAFAPVRTRTFTVVDGPLGVRTSASIKARRVAKLQVGTSVEVDADSRTEADGFIWWRHRTGWSAEGTLDKKGIYMRAAVENGDTGSTDDGSTTPTGIVIVHIDQENQPFDVNTLPQRDALFSLLPVDPSQIEWVQYFGNTTFAYRYGRSWGYDSYSQGLHGGFDLGISPGARVAVRAGGDAKVLKPGLKFSPRRVDVRMGDYLIIYGHLLAETPRVAPGVAIKPDTVIGMIATNVNFSPHVHIEIRYPYPSYHWILNPLLFMPDSIRSRLLAYPTDFYTHALNWSRWKTPFDQPIVQLAGRVIGPRARF